MLRYLPLILQIALTIYALIDISGSRDDRVRTLPKAAWLIISLLPWVGPIAWFIAGRPPREATRVTWKAPPALRRPVAPDDDADFLKKLQQEAADRELMRKWEEDLRRREDELKRRAEGDDPGAGSPSS